MPERSIPADRCSSPTPRWWPIPIAPWIRARGARLPVWSFGYLMKEMVAQRSDVTAQEFVRQWLMLFATPQHVNGQTVAPRNVEALVLKPWEETGFDLSRIPFQRGTARHSRR